MSADGICAGSGTANWTTEGIADGRGLCPQCGQRVKVRPANQGTRFTRMGIATLDWHAASATA